MKEKIKNCLKNFQKNLKTSQCNETGSNITCLSVKACEDTGSHCAYSGESRRVFFTVFDQKLSLINLQKEIYRSKPTKAYRSRFIHHTYNKL